MPCACDHGPMSLFLGLSAGSAFVAGVAVLAGRGHLTSRWAIAALLVAGFLVTVPVTALADGRAPTAEVWLGWAPVLAVAATLMAVAYAWNRRRASNEREPLRGRDKIARYGQREESS